ncbi:hypothetical protein ANO11243_041020 [Dothideomycetidae sp. 11243]|nr:hypothetical protein ANO11243_041020 [fungal sp. No.11243]
MATPPDSPLSSIGSDEERDTPLANANLLSTPSRHRRQSDASHDDPYHPAKRRRLADEVDDTELELASIVSEDSFGSAPGSPSHDEWSMRSDQVTFCQWDGCDRGDLGNSDDLIAHVQNEHVGTKKAKYTCDWGDCARKGMNHPSGYALKAHMRSHTKEKPFFCALPECDRSFTRSDALAKHMRTVHEPEPPKASLTNANPIDPTTGQPKKGPKLRLLNGSKTSTLPATAADKNPLNAGLSPSDPDYDPSPPNDNIRYTPAHHPVTGQPGFLINYPPDIHFTPFESEIPADQLMRLLRRQLHWAKQESEDLSREVDALEAIRQEEWLKKEVTLEALLEAELARAQHKGLARDRLVKAMRADLRTDNLEWSKQPWWREQAKIKANPDEDEEMDVDDELSKREAEANDMLEKAGNAAGRAEQDQDMLAVGALMGLSAGDKGA